MSFSSTVKNELCRGTAGNNCCAVSELAAVIRISGEFRNSKGDDPATIRVITENAAFARRIFAGFKGLYKAFPGVSIRRSSRLKKHILYILTLPGDKWTLNEKIPDKPCCRKAYLRGAFLAGGSLSDPEKTYHLEITHHSEETSGELNALIKSFGLNAKVIRRKGSYVVYIKEGEDLVDFLNIIGAHHSLLELENIRILKEMRNNVNRLVNCETANLEKTVNASVRQVDNIRYIKEKAGFESLPDNLKEIAQLRLSFSEASLKELGEMMSPTLGKSGVNHRLKKLDQIAVEMREEKGDLK